MTADAIGECIGMNAATQAAAAKALDISIKGVAVEEFARLSQGLSDRQIAVKTYRALSALRDLAKNKMPCYNAWDALFYLTWYQPAQINLAYTLTRKVWREWNPLVTGSGRLEVVDFGCGALAMQFGLALAASDTFEQYSSLPEIAVRSEDSSDSMMRLGRKTWRRFVKEISNVDEYAGLDALRRACNAIECEDTDVPGATSWLTILHAAYEETFETVKNQLDILVEEEVPDFVLATARPEAVCWTYSPDQRAGYRPSDTNLSANSLKPLAGSLKETTKFRRCLHNSYKGMIDSMADSQDERPIAYYLSTEVQWQPRDFKARCFFNPRYPSLRS